MLSLIYGIIAIAILILVHEFGHFLLAKLFKVKVLIFSFGFGKRLLTIKSKETEYAISSIPLGGYVKLLGESEEEVKEEEIAFSYMHKPPSQRLLIILFGPLFNILFAFFIFFFVFLTGYSILLPKVGKVEIGYPAYEAGIKEGDRILSINGKEVKEWFDISSILSKTEEKVLKIKIERGGEIKEIPVKTREIEGKNIFGERIKRRVIGISPAEAYLEKREGIFGAFIKAIYQTYNITSLTVLSIFKLLSGAISPKTIGGPLTIFEVAGKQAKEGGKSLLTFLALISINLAIINLFPIPMLDGGHIIFNLIEILLRRRLSIKWVEVSQKIGLGILICIMILALFNDIMRIFFER